MLSVKRDLLQCQKRPTVAPALVNDHLMDIRHVYMCVLIGVNVYY